MKWTVGNIERERFIEVILEGEFSIVEFSDIFQEILSHESWRQGIHILFDDTRLTFKDTNLDMIREASNCYAKDHYRIGDGRVALVMSSPADFIRGRQFEILAGIKIPSNIGVFRDKEKALNWLLND